MFTIASRGCSPPTIRQRAGALGIAFVLTGIVALAVPETTFAACQQTGDCKVGEKCDNGQCKLIPTDSACGKDEDCGQSHSCVNGSCRAPRIGTTTVERVEPAIKTDATLVPELNVPIPGLVLGGSAGGGAFFAQFVSAGYRYALSILAVAATVMFVWGAFLYLIGASSGEAKRGREIMTDAVVGMLLVLGAHLILSTINPATVNIKSLTIRQVTRDAFGDPALERARVEASAAVPPSRAPVVNEDTGEVTGISSFQKWKESKGVAKEKSGSLVAIKKCPSDMIAIRKSPTYKKANVDSFCIDRYEAPNQEGAYPIVGVLDWEADWFCDLIGKRLCTTQEWQRACLGPDGKNTYGYGPTYIPGRIVSAKIPNVGTVKPTGNGPAPCNYDSQASGFVTANTDAILRATFPPPSNRVHSILNPSNPALNDPTPRYCHMVPAEGGKFTCKEKISYAAAFELLKAEEKRITEGGIEPSGYRKDCKTAEEVYDMTANVQEVTVKDSFKDLTTDDRFGLGDVSGSSKPYQWVGFYFSPVSHLGNTSAEPTCTQSPGGAHNITWRPFENGFRCCMTLDTGEEQAPPVEVGTP
ncbi:MAG TPA: pilin [Candidatus Methylomirabilis sp.]|nr:pilin [Candidatus Methylomirabilis sp.]